MTADGQAADPAVEPIDWPSATGRRFPVRPRTLAFLATAGAVVAAWVYDAVYVGPGLVPFWGWSPGVIGYLLYLTLAFTVFYVVVPLAQRPTLTRRYWRRLRDRPTAMAALGYLVVFVLVGTFGPGAIDHFGIGSYPPYGPPLSQPPVWGEIDMSRTNLINICAGETVDGVCHGSWAFPLGTTVQGKDMIDATVAGARVALEIAFVTAALIVLLATLVGTVAAVYGGWVDELSMRVVDVLQVIPAIFVVIILQERSPRIITIVAVFGLLEWGSVARLVRSEALQRVEEQYITAARSAGASRLAIVRGHVVPNVSNTLVTAATAQMPRLIVIEASIAFLGFTDPFGLSWGATIGTGLHRLPTYWWMAIFPGIALVLTALSLHVLGDALRDVLDPRMDGRA